MNMNLDNILSGEDIANLFTGNNEENQESSPEQKEEIENTETEETTEVNPEDLFGGPESVGSEEDTSEEGKDAGTQGSGTSPKNNFYSSIAKALKEDGIFPDLDDDSIDEIKKPEDFLKFMEDQMAAKLDEKQRRINEALGVGIEPSKIQQYERVISYYNEIDDDAIEDESDKGEQLRKQLIYQDFINRGFTKDRALKQVQKAFDANTDIEDAKDAYRDGKKFFEDSYKNLMKEAKEAKEKEDREVEEERESLKKSILEDKKAFGVINLDKATRQKIYDNIDKPVYKDPVTGDVLTTIQKYERDNHNEFMKNIGLLYTLTDGFKNIDRLVNSEVKKKVSKGIRELEHTLSGTQRDSGGNLRFVTGVDEDPESYSGKGWDIDLS